MSDASVELQFPSARDRWLVALLWTAVGVLTAATAPVLCAPLSTWVRLTSVAFAAGSAAFVLWVLYGTGYALGPETLRIRSGPFRWNVRLAEIAEVVPSHNPLSSPACSLDRLHVRHAGSRRGVLISPEDRAGFLRALAARAPQLRFEGDRLVS